MSSSLSTARAQHLSQGMLALILVIQTFTHLSWLSISAHSGQVAIPFMMNQGMSLFGTVWEQHAPVTSVIAALVQRFLPFTPLDTARLLNLVTVSAITLLVYHLAFRMAGNSPLAGITAVLFWAWWEPVYGVVLFYFDTLLGLCLCIALLIWITLSDRRPLTAAFLAGLFMGLATLAKQHAWAALIVFGVFLFLQSRKHFVRYLVGALFPPLALIGVIAINGNLERYAYWNWVFNFSGLMEGAPLTGDLMRKLTLSNLFTAPLALLLVRAQSPKRAWLLLFLLWGSAGLTLIPRFSTVHAMAHLPLAAVITGVVIGTIVAETSKPASAWIANLPHTHTRDLVLIGMLLVVGAAIVWTGGVVYVPNALGRAAVPAYDEFTPLAQRLTAMSKAGETLFILPETDSTPNIHVMSGLLPPGTWVKGWRWYLQAPGVIERLLGEWQRLPPDWVIVFPDMIIEGQPAIQSLLDWVIEHYQVVDVVEAVVFHGDALIYQRKAP